MNIVSKILAFSSLLVAAAHASDDCVIDDDLTDGKPGRDLGLVFMDPTHGSDCAVIRDLQGKFHVIYEDWTPIDASKHAWD